MKRLITLLCFACLSAVAARAAGTAAGKPNVLIILADDQGWGDLSVNGNSSLATPHIDSLAKTGAILDRFYVCPVCSPTRAEFLTGRYHPRGGVRDVSRGGERLNLDEKTIADTFKAAGYKTGAFGKWHNGTQWPYHPNARGFDEYYGFTSGHWGSYFDPPLDHNGQPVQGKGFIIDDLTDHALQFIEANRDRPFFCYLPYNTPHSPMQVPERFWRKFARADLKLRSRDPKQEDVDFTRAALAMCENIDWNVGRVLQRLDELKLADNTVVLYFSDNGPNSWRWNGGMKGRKGTTDEGGMRSPFLIRWPGHIPVGLRVPQIAAAIDLFPTLADLAGIPIASQKPLDGVSLKPLLTGTAKDWPDRMIFSHWTGKVSVRTPRHRLDSAGKLFDMEADPGQDRDLAKDQPAITARLSKAVAEWRSEMLAGLRNDDRPFAVGYPAFPLTQLPARDGLPHGAVQRSASAPNCSYFQNWTRPEDSITWDIEVATAGRYEAVIYYTCPAADIGSTIELSFNGNRIEGVVAEANDPPLRGAENDRVVRKGESYVKDFQPLRLGVIELKPGRGLLTLRALKVPGKQVMDVRAVHLKLLTTSASTASDAAAPETLIHKRVADRELKLFLEKPMDWKSTDRRPAIVFFFGGGWVGGSPTQFLKQSQYLASRGMVGIRVEYRTIPKGDAGPPILCCADAKSALRFVRAQASELGIDPQRIAAAGGSAGGHLAAFTALVNGLDDPKDDLVVSCKPNALVLFNPVFNNGPGQWGHARVGDRYREFSPAHNITKGAPPTIVFLGDKDRLIPVSTLREFEAEMRKVGARCEAHVYPGAGHGFFNRDTTQGAWFTQTLLETDKFLASLGWLKGEPTLK